MWSVGISARAGAAASRRPAAREVGGPAPARGISASTRPRRPGDRRPDHRATRYWRPQSGGRGVGYGVPTLFFPDGQCLFGPVSGRPADRGRGKSRLWDAVVAWTEFPHLYELQRPKTNPPTRRVIADTFQPLPGGPRLVSINRRQGDQLLTTAKSPSLLALLPRQQSSERPKRPRPLPR